MAKTIVIIITFSSGLLAFRALDTRSTLWHLITQSSYNCFLHVLYSKGTCCIQESQDHALYELIHESLRIKKSNNAKYLKIIVRCLLCVMLHTLVTYNIGFSCSFRTNRISFLGYHWQCSIC